MFNINQSEVIVVYIVRHKSSMKMLTLTINLQVQPMTNLVHLGVCLGVGQLELDGQHYVMNFHKQFKTQNIYY